MDMDNDTFPDMFIGTHSGEILTYKWNETLGSYDRLRGPWEHIMVGHDTVVSCADLDGDGDNDCVVGEENGNINYFQNIGDVAVPIFVQRHGEFGSSHPNPFHHIDVGDNSHPALMDADNDGLIDIVIGSKDGKIIVYINDGTATHSHYTDFEHLVDPVSAEAFIGYYTKPVAVDMNGDTLSDFVVTAEQEDPSAVVLDGAEYSMIGAVSVLGMITLSGMIFLCRNSKKTAPLVTSQFDPEKQSLTKESPRTNEAPVLGITYGKQKLKFGVLNRNSQR